MAKKKARPTRMNQNQHIAQIRSLADIDGERWGAAAVEYLLNYWQGDLRKEELQMARAMVEEYILPRMGLMLGQFYLVDPLTYEVTEYVEDEDGPVGWLFKEYPHVFHLYSDTDPCTAMLVPDVYKPRLWIHSLAVRVGHITVKPYPYQIEQWEPLAAQRLADFLSEPVFCMIGRDAAVKFDTELYTDYLNTPGLFWEGRDVIIENGHFSLDIFSGNKHAGICALLREMFAAGARSITVTNPTFGPSDLVESGELPDVADYLHAEMIKQWSSIGEKTVRIDFSMHTSVHNGDPNIYAMRVSR